jgi:hypothetical protein
VGGFGSGRRGNTATAEGTSSYMLTISKLAPAFQEGQCLTCAIYFDGDKFPVVVTVDLTTERNCFLELIHKTRDFQEGDRIVTGRVDLASTVPTFGGRRWWFFCPRTGCRAAKLFLPAGGWHFWSRQAYRLGYACQREDRFRLQRRAAVLNRQLGGQGKRTWNVRPAKPKWMRWRTYARKIERWELAVEKANEEFARGATRILKQSPG